MNFTTHHWPLWLMWYRVWDSCLLVCDIV